MESTLIEWGPAPLREDATAPAPELTERTDDN